MFVTEAPDTLKYIKTLFRNSFEILIFVIILAVKWGGETGSFVTETR